MLPLSRCHHSVYHPLFLLPSFLSPYPAPGFVDLPNMWPCRMWEICRWSCSQVCVCVCVCMCVCVCVCMWCVCVCVCVCMCVHLSCLFLCISSCPILSPFTSTVTSLRPTTRIQCSWAMDESGTTLEVFHIHMQCSTYLQ